MAPKQTLEHVLAQSIPVTESGCWIWLGTEVNGYGQIKVNGRSTLAHRYVYEQLVGPIPPGLDMDHLCRVTQCINPNHVEPVTTQVNILRGISPAALHAKKTHCDRGHELFGENLRLGKTKNDRICKVCDRLRGRQYQQRLYEAEFRSLFLGLSKWIRQTRGASGFKAFVGQLAMEFEQEVPV